MTRRDDGRRRRRILVPAATLVAIAVGLGLRSTTNASALQSPALKVLTSGGFTAAFRTLSTVFESNRRVHIVTELGASLGTTPTAIPMRLNRHESADVVILAREALDELVTKGQVGRGSEVDLALSRIAMAVRAGAPVPNISTVDEFRRTLVAARSVAYSDSASGVYLQTELFPRLGIGQELARTGRVVPGTPVGEVVAKGEAEIGFQQLSELKPVAGIKIVGLIPEPLQKVTAFSAGIVSWSEQPQLARDLIAFLASPAAFAVIRETGMEPAPMPVGAAR